MSWAGPERLFPPGLQIEDLPDIDILVISHAHYDHLDTYTLDRLPNRETITALVPLGLGKYFVERNFGKVIEMDWYDEFELDGPLDPLKWHHQTQLPNGNSWYNGEIQHYTDREQNSYVSDGTLKIVAKRETYTDQGHTKEFTSARLNSKYAFTYGKENLSSFTISNKYVS